MIELAITGRAGFEISTIELRRGGVSYTADTLAEMHCSAPDDQLFFLLGADSLADFNQWVRPAEICRLATLLVVQRPDLADPNVDDLMQLLSPSGVEAQIQVVNMDPTPISSSHIRQQIRAGESRWQDSVAPSVAEYIEQRGLYR
jgi:nicotinate-nucleotide adenylyltransferase